MFLKMITFYIHFSSFVHSICYNHNVLYRNQAHIGGLLVKEKEMGRGDRGERQKEERNEHRVAGQQVSAQLWGVIHSRTA